MSKRAEDAALKICPPMIVKDEDGSLDDLTYMARTWVQKGYELAEKDLGWHSVDESLPPIDEEVIVLTDDLNTAPIYKIAIGHIVDRIYCSDYDWNIPGVKYWMPMPKIPKEDE